MGFPWEEYWSGLPFLSPGIKPVSPVWQVDSLPLSHLGSHYFIPDLPVAPQDEAGLTTTFQTWPRGWFHVPKDPDFPVPS